MLPGGREEIPFRGWESRCCWAEIRSKRGGIWGTRTGCRRSVVCRIPLISGCGLRAIRAAVTSQSLLLLLSGTLGCSCRLGGGAAHRQAPRRFHASSGVVLACFQNSQGVGLRGPCALAGRGVTLQHTVLLLCMYVRMYRLALWQLLGLGLGGACLSAHRSNLGHGQAKAEGIANSPCELGAGGDQADCLTAIAMGAVPHPEHGDWRYRPVRKDQGHYSSPNFKATFDARML